MHFSLKYGIVDRKCWPNSCHKIYNFIANSIFDVTSTEKRILCVLLFPCFHSLESLIHGNYTSAPSTHLHYLHTYIFNVI